ncbi:unnamed protein product, partial [Ectocarpus fasciculatus]
MYTMREGYSTSRTLPPLLRTPASKRKPMCARPFPRKGKTAVIQQRREPSRHQPQPPATSHRIINHNHLCTTNPTPVARAGKTAVIQQQQGAKASASSPTLQLRHQLIREGHV